MAKDKQHQMLRENTNAIQVDLRKYRGGHLQRVTEYENKYNNDSDWGGCSYKKLKRAKRSDTFELNYLPKLVKKYGDKISYDGDKCIFTHNEIKICYYPKANSIRYEKKWTGGINKFFNLIEKSAFKDSDDNKLSRRFVGFIERYYKCLNTYEKNFCWIPQKAGVYIFVAFNSVTNTKRIVYIGSSNNLFRRYSGHNIPDKILSIFNDTYPLFYFIELEKGFYDYEMKLIKKLKPIFNKLTYGG